MIIFSFPIYKESKQETKLSWLEQPIVTFSCVNECIRKKQLVQQSATTVEHFIFAVMP